MHTTYYHTSCNEITTIENDTLFKDVFFFTHELTEEELELDSLLESNFIYSMEMNESEYINRKLLGYELNIVESSVTLEVAKKFGSSLEQAVSLLDGSEKLKEVNDDWYLQGAAARVAKELGYKGCILEDESIAIPMFGREDELTDVTDFI